MVSVFNLYNHIVNQAALNILFLSQMSQWGLPLPCAYIQACWENRLLLNGAKYVCCSIDRQLLMLIYIMYVFSQLKNEFKATRNIPVQPCSITPDCGLYHNTSFIRHRPIRWITSLKYKNVSLKRHHAPTFNVFPPLQIGKVNAWCFPILSV